MSDLVDSNDVATNGVNCRIGNKTWCKCEYCTSVETSIDSVCCLKIPDICKSRFQVHHVCTIVDSHFFQIYIVLWYSWGENYSQLIDFYMLLLILGKSEKKLSITWNLAIIIFFKTFQDLIIRSFVL